MHLPLRSLQEQLVLERLVVERQEQVPRAWWLLAPLVQLEPPLVLGQQV